MDSQQQNTGAQQTTNTTNSNNSNEDYGDKALDFIEKKSGHTMGRDTNEKITDGARGMFEKLSKTKVPEKYSN